MWNRSCTASQRSTVGVFLGGVVVANEVHLEVGGGTTLPPHHHRRARGQFGERISDSP